MQDMDAIEFTKKITQDEKYEDMKLVMMTSLKDRGNALEYRKIGINSSFPKPATTNDLLLALDTLSGDLAQEIIVEEEVDEVLFSPYTNILLVEDNLTNQLVANGILEGFSLEADIANNGIEALEILNANEKRYDIILMDCQMPEMDGYETTRAIRNELAGESYKGITIVAMTANAMQGDKEKCELSGMDGYLAKPINPEKLKEVLKKYLPNHEPSMKPQILNENVESSNSFNTLVWNEEDVLQRLGGSQKLLKKIMKVFLEDITEQTTNLLEAVKKEDKTKVKLHAHTIKGAAGNLSALRLQQLAKDIEFASATKTIDELKALALHVEKAITEIIDIFKEYLGDLKSSNKDQEVILKDDVISLLYTLNTDLKNGSFIDSSELELFNTSYDESIDKQIDILKNKIDNFMTDDASAIIESIITSLGGTNGK
jgi:CheY-like chemotaxis protein/HPt (histidine-containing phosphotransfer) domain-containing protein